MKAIIKALNLPTTYKVIRFAKGNLTDGRYTEVATLHSGTGGHQTVFAQYLLDGGWKEINSATHDLFVRSIFRI